MLFRFGIWVMFLRLGIRLVLFRPSLLWRWFFWRCWDFGRSRVESWVWLSPAHRRLGHGPIVCNPVCGLADIDRGSCSQGGKSNSSCQGEIGELHVDEKS